MQSKPKELKICHLADIHLGYRRFNKLTQSGLNQREFDVSQAFSESITKIIQIKPSLCIIAGDLFHSVRPSNLVLNFCFREIKRLSQAIAAPIIIVAGNHETPKRSDTGCILRLLAEIDHVYVADTQVQNFNFKELDLSVSCVPHAALQQKDLEIRADENFTHNILVVHGQVGSGWMSDLGGSNIDPKKFNFTEWDYVALGHVHTRQEVALNAHYSGSIEYTSNNMWMEAKQKKGFLEVSLPKSQVKFHQLNSPRDLIELSPIDAEQLEPSEIDQYIAQRINNIPGGIEGKIIRLELLNLPREVYRLLDHKQIKLFRQSALNLTLEVRAPQIKSEIATINSQQKRNLLEELSGYAQEISPNHNLSPIFNLYWKKVEDKLEAENRQELQS